MTFIDDHTRLCWIDLLNKKSKVEGIFQNFYHMIENQFQTKMSILRSDNGIEYFNTILESFLQEKGILHQSTCTDTPKHNGIVERKNKHLLEVARTMMFPMNVPKYLWEDVVLTTSYLINRMPSKVLQYTSPLKYLNFFFQSHVSIQTLPLKVFGCTTYVHIPKKSRSKLDPSRKECFCWIYSK